MISMELKVEDISLEHFILLRNEKQEHESITNINDKFNTVIDYLNLLVTLNPAKAEEILCEMDTVLLRLKGKIGQSEFAIIKKYRREYIMLKYGNS